jgi:chromosome segregation ATPase
LDDKQKELLDSINGMTTSNQTLNDYQKSISEVVSSVSKFDGTNLNAVVGSLQNIEQIKGNTKLVEFLRQFATNSEAAADKAKRAADETVTLSDAMKALDKGLSGSSEHMNAFSSVIVSSKAEIDLLNKAQSELKDNNQLSASTISDLNEKYSDFIKVTGLSKDEIYKFINAKKEEKNAVIEAEIEKTRKTIEATRDRISAMQDEYDMMVKLIDAKADDLTVDNLRAEQIALNSPYNDAQKELTALITKYNILTNTLSDFKNDTTESKSATDSNYDSISDTVEILTELQKQLKNVQKLQDEEENKRRRMRQSSKE